MTEEFDTKSTEYKQCVAILNTEQMRGGLLQTNVTSEQMLANSQQVMLNNQQAAINSCVVSLGKMNPQINTKFAVLNIPVASNMPQKLTAKSAYFSRAMVNYY